MKLGIAYSIIGLVVALLGVYFYFSLSGNSSSQNDEAVENAYDWLRYGSIMLIVFGGALVLVGLKQIRSYLS